MRYRQPLRFDDVVDVHLRLANVTRATFQMAYLLTVGEQPCATAVTVHGMINANGSPIRIPAVARRDGHVERPLTGWHRSAMTLTKRVRG